MASQEKLNHLTVRCQTAIQHRDAVATIARVEIDNVRREMQVSQEQVFLRKMRSMHHVFISITCLIN